MRGVGLGDGAGREVVTCAWAPSVRSEEKIDPRTLPQQNLYGGGTISASIS